VADLAPRPAWAGLDLPAIFGGVTLAAPPETPMRSIAPYRNRAAALDEALGAPLPEPGRSVELADGLRLIWAGLDLWFLRGPGATAEFAERIASHAAVTDQSDGWTALALTGTGAADVLARLVPLDLDPAAFPPGAAARTELRHIACLIRAMDGGFELLVMRSFTATAVHEIAAAMRAVAARAELPEAQRSTSARIR